MKKPSQRNAVNESFQKTLSRLASFSYQFDQGNQVDLTSDLHNHLVLHAFASIENGWNNIEAIQSQIKKMFDLNFDSAEIQLAITGLVKSGKVERSRDDSGFYRIHSIEKIKINDSVDTKRDLKLRVIQEWFNQIENETKIKLTMNEKQYLQEDIEVFIGLLAAEGGAQMVKAAFGGTQEDAELFSVIEHKPKWKKRGDEYNKLRNNSIQLFLKRPTEMRQKFVIELVDSAFFLSLLHVDSDLSSLAKSALQNKILFLDSNIVYRLLGLQTESLQGMTQRVVDASQKEFGCTLFVSQLSIVELKTSLERAVKYIKANPPLERDFEKIKLQFTGESRGFIIAYWKEYAAHGTTIEHFANKYANIDKILLDQYDIKVTTDYMESVIKDPVTGYEINQFKKFLVSKEQNRPLSDNVIVPGQLPKHEKLINHDVRLLRVVEKARGEACSKFSEAKAWLLTADADLINYSISRRQKGDAHIPAAIHARDWLLFLRQWLPRNDDYDKVFIDLVFSERIQSFSSFSPIIIDQVVRILSSYNNVSPQLAAEFMADFDFTRKLMVIQKKAEIEFSEDYGEDNLQDAERVELLQGIIAEKTKNLIDARLVNMLEKKEAERATAQYDRMRLEEKLSAEKHEKEDVSIKLNDQKGVIDELTKTVNEVSGKLNEVSGKLENVEGSNKDLEKSLQISRWAIGILILLLLVFWVEPFVQNLLVGFATQEFIIYFRFATYLIALSLLFGFGLGVKKIWGYVSIIDAVAGVIGVLWLLYSLFFDK